MIPKGLGMMLDTLLENDTLLSWHIYNEQSGHITVKLRFNGEHSSQAPMVRQNIAFKRLNNKQLQRNKDRSEAHKSRITNGMITRSKSRQEVEEDGCEMQRAEDNSNIDIDNVSYDLPHEPTGVQPLSCSSNSVCTDMDSHTHGGSDIDLLTSTPTQASLSPVDTKVNKPPSPDIMSPPNEDMPIIPMPPLPPTPASVPATDTSRTLSPIVTDIQDTSSEQSEHTDNAKSRRKAIIKCDYCGEDFNIEWKTEVLTCTHPKHKHPYYICSVCDYSIHHSHGDKYLEYIDKDSIKL